MTSNGRVLVTGGTGALGAAATKWLTRNGHDVVILARHEPRTLRRGVAFVPGDIADISSVRRGMDGCDTVVHLAWALSGSVTHDDAEPINIGGTRNVLRAMADTGCTRMVFASSVTAYGAHQDHPQPWQECERLDPAYGLVYEWHKAQAEQIIAGSGVEAVRVRPTVVVGRDAHNAPANVYRQIGIPDLGRATIQMVHQDDVGRFLAHACDSRATGAVNLAADDALTWSEVARLAGRPAIPTPLSVLFPALRAAARLIPAARSAPELFDLFVHWPLADTTRLREEFGFRLAFSSAEAIADQGRGSTTHIVLGMKEFRRPTKLDTAWARDAAQADEGGRSIRVLPSEVHGEFDTAMADPDYPEWTCANLAEAFPGPMTPLSLELIKQALFTGADQVARILPLSDRIRDNIRRRQLGVFGHRFYQNVSVLSEMAAGLPGQTPEDFDHQINGEPYPDDYLRPKLAVADVLGYLKFAAGAGPRLAGLGKAVESIEESAQASCWAADTLTAATDEALHARIETLWDQCVDGWRVGLLCTFLVTAPVAILERRYGVDAVTRPHQHDTSLASSRLLLGVQELSRKAKRSPKAAALLAGAIDSSSWAELQRSDPEYASDVRTLLTVAGHRGPGETELASHVYADAPWLLLRAISGAADREPPPPDRTDSLDTVGERLAKASWSAIGRRERCRDAVMVLTHQLRTALREWGSRLAARGCLAEGDDIFYLTYDELCGTDPDLAGKVTRRRIERARLAKLDLPIRFSQPMDLSKHADPAQFDRVIVGVPAVSGVAVGRVRVLRSPDDDLEPGEVLVTRVTDTGWTPFFGTASAVVTDIGGAMSHASIVAREFGIPAVVGTKHASQLLVDGQLVEVNGQQGTVTILD